MSARGDDRRPLLSVAMIVRNEAPLLEECLKNIRPWPDEICVVDTGSDDASATVAEASGCRVGRFAWCGDFAAARNASLALCRGEWIFVLDADERIAPGDGPRIRALTEGGTGRCHRFTTRNYTNNVKLSEFIPSVPGAQAALLPEAAGGVEFAGWHPSTKVRLFPNRPEARFEGEVHEMVNSSLARAGLEILTSEIPVHHFPEARAVEDQVRKQELYVQLGLRKIAARPEDPHAHAELGDQYADMGNYANAVRCYREALRLCPDHTPWLAHLGGVLFLLGRGVEAEQTLTLAVRRAPDLTGAWRNLAAIHSSREDWEGAVRCLEAAVAAATEPAALLGDLALALESCNRLEESARAARSSLEALPVPGPTASRYLGLMRRLGRADEGRAFLEDLAARHGVPRLADTLEQQPSAPRDEQR